MTKEEISCAVDSALSVTSDVLSRALMNSNNIIEHRDQKRLEGQQTMAAAHDLYTTASRFTSLVENYEVSRDHTMVETMGSTNKKLENTLDAFNELVTKNTSPKATLLTNMLKMMTPALAPVLFFGYLKLGKSI